MICGRQGLRKYKDKHKDKHRQIQRHIHTKTKSNTKKNTKTNTRHMMLYVFGNEMTIGSQIMKNKQNMQIMQNTQNMLNISPLFFSSKDQKSQISESEPSVNSRTCLVSRPSGLIVFAVRPSLPMIR